VRVEVPLPPAVRRPAATCKPLGRDFWVRVRDPPPSLRLPSGCLQEFVGSLWAPGRRHGMRKRTSCYDMTGKRMIEWTTPRFLSHISH